MAEKISGYAADATSNPIKLLDLMDFSNEDGGGGHDVSKKIQVGEFVTFLNGTIVNLYNADGTLAGPRIVTHSGNSLTHLGGDVIITMDEEITDYAFIIQDVSNTEFGRYGYDQVTDSGVFELRDLAGIWYEANDSQIVLGGSVPFNATIMYDIRFPDGSNVPLAFYEDNPAGASVGENYSLEFYFNDDVFVRTLGGTITARVGSAPTTGNVNMDMIFHDHMKVQFNDRVLFTPNVSSKAAVAHVEIRGEAGVTANTNFLSRGNGDTASSILIFTENGSGDNVMIQDAVGKTEFNLSNFAGGDTVMRSLNNNDLFHLDASVDGIGIGIATPNVAAIMEFSSTTKGVLFPRMTAAQGSAITPTNGLVIYVTDTDATFTAAGFWGYESGAWAKII